MQQNVMNVIIVFCKARKAEEDMVSLRPFDHSLEACGWRRGSQHTQHIHARTPSLCTLVRHLQALSSSSTAIVATATLVLVLAFLRRIKATSSESARCPSFLKVRS